MTEEVKETRRNWLPLAIVVAAIILAVAWVWGSGTETANSATEEELASAIAIAIANAERGCGCYTVCTNKVEGSWFGFATGYDEKGKTFSEPTLVEGPAIIKPHSGTNDIWSLDPETDMVVTGVVWRYQGTGKKAIEGLRAQYQFFPLGKIVEHGEMFEDDFFRP